jgi:hypothetical protein
MALALTGCAKGALFGGGAADAKTLSREVVTGADQAAAEPMAMEPSPDAAAYPAPPAPPMDALSAGGFGPSTGATTTAAYGAGGAKEAPNQAPAPKKKPDPQSAQGAGGGSAGSGGEGQGQGTGGPASDQGKRSPILIYTADYTMSVFEVAKSIESVESLAKEAGGYLSRKDDTSITIRVPAGKFKDVVIALDKIGDVLHRNVVSEDVTAEYHDLEVQLQNLVALRARFEKLLEKAQKVEEALQVERELGRITGEIERIKGRLKLLTELSQYSTITVSFQPRANSEVQEGPFLLPLPWVSNVGLRRLMAL